MIRKDLTLVIPADMVDDLKEMVRMVEKHTAFEEDEDGEKLLNLLNEELR